LTVLRHASIGLVSLVATLTTAPPFATADEAKGSARPGSNWIAPNTGYRFIGLPGGTLVGGSFPNERVAPFSLGRTAVTVTAYATCVNAGACRAPNAGGKCNWNSGRINHPMNCVDWKQARTFCAWIGGRLPTAQEREWAASGGEGREYPWGSEPPGRQACWNGAGNDRGKGKRRTTCPVGSYPAGASKHGLLDLAGDVWEWLDTDYGGGKEVRGGSWYRPDAMYLRASQRYGANPLSRLSLIGFRCGL
jgi:formylglycine-generating enzyme required for sulfatase activity